MKEKPVEKWDYDELLDWLARSSHDALLKGGGSGLRTHGHSIVHVVNRWHVAQQQTAKK